MPHQASSSVPQKGQQSAPAKAASTPPPQDQQGREDRACYNCGQQGHLSSACPHERRPRNPESRRSRNTQNEHRIFLDEASALITNHQYSEALDVLQNGKVLHYEFGKSMTSEELVEWTKSCKAARAGVKAQSITPKQAVVPTMVVSHRDSYSSGTEEECYEEDYQEDPEDFQEGV